MSNSLWCRICLANCFRMYLIANSPLQDVFEKLTNLPLHTEYKKPTTICYICYSQLRKCHKLMQMAVRADKLLSVMLATGKEIETHQNVPPMHDRMWGFQSQVVVNIYIGQIVEHVTTVKCEEEGAALHDASCPIDLDIKTGVIFREPQNVGSSDNITDLPVVKKCRIKFTPHNPSVQTKCTDVDEKIAFEQSKDDLNEGHRTGANFRCTKNKLEISSDEEQEQIESTISDVHSSISKTEVSNDKHIIKIQAFQPEDLSNIISKNKKKSSQFQCHHCNKNFLSKRYLVSHIKLHSGEKPFKCNHCSKCFNRREILNEHTRIHTGVKPYECRHCKKCFSQHGSLKTHLRIHSGDRPYKCNHCSKYFSQFAHLTKHITIHTGDKPFMCDHCSKCFSRRDFLTEHIKIHTGEKPYKCNHCGKAFSQHGSLTRHMRIHTGDKPYKCNNCTKCFTQRGNLKKHKRIHTGLKPFKCTLCSKCFSEHGNLSKHLRVHTGDKPYKTAV